MLRCEVHRRVWEESFVPDFVLDHLTQGFVPHLLRQRPNTQLELLLTEVGGAQQPNQSVLLDEASPVQL